MTEPEGGDAAEHAVAGFTHRTMAVVRHKGVIGGAQD